MPRRVQDIIPGDRRSVREEQPAEETHHPDKSRGRKVSLRRMPLAPPPTPPPKHRRKPGRHLFSVGVAIIVVVIGIAAAGWAASASFSHATFTIVPRSVPVSVNVSVVASGTSTSGYLGYQVARFDAAGAGSVPATSGATVSTKAQGLISIYDTYSTQSQRLVAGTRFVDSTGLIYKLTGSIVVPGYTTAVGGKIVPGTIKAAVVADQPGQQYNVSSTDIIADWKIAAYQGGPKYDGFYARPVSTITGGFLGQKETIDPTVLASTSATLAASVTASLLTQAEAAVPSDSIMYSSAYTTVVAAPIVSSASSTNMANISEHVTLYSVLFKRSDLVTKLAGDENTSSFGGFTYDTPGLDQLSFSISNAKDFSPTTKSVLIAHFSGSMKLVGDVPVADLKNKLAGLPLSATGDVLEGYKQVIDIAKSSGELSPPWVSTVPTDQSRISIVIPAQ